MIPEPVWVTWATVLAIHQQQLKEHGGSSGIRDRNLLESALARPRQIFNYADDPSLAQLAAAYTSDSATNERRESEPAELKGLGRAPDAGESGRKFAGLVESGKMRRLGGSDRLRTEGQQTRFLNRSAGEDSGCVLQFSG